jgi:antitoxin component HigA of HigAB toxin-antitoxin module
MQVKPIRSKEDHAEALQRIEELWGATPGTEEGDLLDVLVTLVEVYEREHFPIDLPDPVEAIKFRFGAAGQGLPGAHWDYRPTHSRLRDHASRSTALPHHDPKPS